MVVEGGARHARIFTTEAEAQAVAAELRAELEQPSVTVSRAIEMYREHQEARGLRPRTCDTAGERLAALFRGEDDLVVADLAKRRASAIFAAFCARPIRRGGRATGKASSADHRRNVLAEARRWSRWCMRRGWLPADPFAEIDTTELGRRRRGRRQLRVTEARRFEAAARAEADRADATGVAALAALYLGARATELMARVVRDLDDDGRLLWIDEAKTETGRRALEIPEALRPYLVAQAAGKLPAAALIGTGHDRHWLHYHVERLCRAAGVPEVTPHGLRGTHATLARDAGASGHLVAAALGHASETVTERHYLEPGTVERQQQRRTMSVLKGGKK